MSMYDFFIKCLAIGVISIGILLLVNGIISYSKNGGLDIGFGCIVIFLGSYLIFVRWAFGDKRVNIEESFETLKKDDMEEDQ